MVLAPSSKSSIEHTVWGTLSEMKTSRVCRTTNDSRYGRRRRTSSTTCSSPRNMRTDSKQLDTSSKNIAADAILPLLSYVHQTEARIFRTVRSLVSARRSIVTRRHRRRRANDRRCRHRRRALFTRFGRHEIGGAAPPDIRRALKRPTIGRKSKNFARQFFDDCTHSK